MEGSMTFEAGTGDIRPLEPGNLEFIPESGATRTIEKAREKYALIEEWEKEKESLEDQVKALKKRIEGAESEIRVLVCRRGEQLEIPTSAPIESTEDPKVCRLVPGGKHDWHRIREIEGVALEDCLNCGLERTARVLGPDGIKRISKPSWAYTRPVEGAL